MAFTRIKIVRKNGKEYRYEQRQTSVRVPGKKNPKSVYLGTVGGGGRKAADERYREVLRENVYLYGKARPGERYAREAWAREQYHQRISEDASGEKRPDEKVRDAFERWQTAGHDFHAAQERFKTQHAPHIREAAYHASHQSPQSRAEGEQVARKAAAEEELAQASATSARNACDVDDAYEAREAARDAAVEEYTEMANGEDAASDKGGKSDT